MKVLDGGKLFPFSWIGNISKFEMAILWKLFSRFLSYNPYKITTHFSYKLKVSFSYYYGNRKKPKITTTFLNNKVTARGLTIPDLKLHYKATVIKTA